MNTNYILKTPRLLALTWLLIGVPLCQAVPQLAGYWRVTEKVTLKAKIAGETDTEKQSGTATIRMYQSGSKVYYYRTVPDPNTGESKKVKRTGKISGNKITFDGIAMLPINGAKISKNSMVTESKISKNNLRIDGVSKVEVKLSFKGRSGTVTGSGTVVMVKDASSAEFTKPRALSSHLIPSRHSGRP